MSSQVSWQSGSDGSLPVARTPLATTTGPGCCLKNQVFKHQQTLASVYPRAFQTGAGGGTGATEVDRGGPNSPAALLARELALRIGRPPAARRGAGPAGGVAFVARFGGGSGRVGVLDDPGQRSRTCGLLGPFHDEDGAGLQDTRGGEG